MNILDTSSVSVSIKEATEIQLHQNNIIREEGFKLSQAWNPAVNILQTSDT
jgi:hypothetical protein